jgi:DNA-binding LacI/PurR family transcriptional regulator
MRSLPQITEYLFLPPLSTVQLPHYDIGRLSALHIIHGDNHRETPDGGREAAQYR